MSQLLAPVLSAATPNDGPRSARMPNAFTVPGSADGTNPLYDRSLSVAERLARGHEYLAKYCQERKLEIDSIVHGASREVALQELISVLRFVVELRTNGTWVIRKDGVKALMGEHMVGPDAKIFLGRDIGRVPELPDNILDILRSRCELTNDGRTVAQTHCLVLIPASIDGVATSVISLANFVGDIGKSFSFSRRGWYLKENFASQPARSSRWVLMYTGIAPNTWNRTDAEQAKAIKAYPNYQTVDALGAIGALLFGFLEHGRSYIGGRYAQTQDRAASRARVGVGFTLSCGLDIFDSGIVGTLPRAVCWKLS